MSSGNRMWKTFNKMTTFINLNDIKEGHNSLSLLHKNILMDQIMEANYRRVNHLQNQPYRIKVSNSPALYINKKK
ncbi:hypothetical protein CPAV1605_489 [seawater metagenome]|uniref:Uncharacterized protein n=1 Tax=seawater metagenome TaxID=1561972 RepID=A0A5E8CJF9_9ZZZZ